MVREVREALEVAVFATEVGWLALAGRAGRAVWLGLGYRCRQRARQAVGRWSGTEVIIERDWEPALRRRLSAYLAGRPEQFFEVPIELLGVTPFQRRVLDTCRQIGYGEVLSYGELARRSGRPGAARAVGSALARNPLPIIVPCHRVLRSDGRLGGFSAPGGVRLKRRLLALERAAC